MLRPVLALLVLLGAPISIAHAQSEQDIEPAPLAGLGDPTGGQPRSAARAEPGGPRSIAPAHIDGEEIDPATLAVLHDPGRRRLRISVVEADLMATEQRLAALPDRTPWHVALGVGIALGAAGASAELVALAALGAAELGSGIGCGVSTLFSRSCSDPPTPEWIITTAIAGAPAFLVGLVTLAIGGGQLDSIRRQERRIERRRDGRLRELDLLRSFDVRATGDSVVLGAWGTF